MIQVDERLKFEIVEIPEDELEFADQNDDRRINAIYEQLGIFNRRVAEKYGQTDSEVSAILFGLALEILMQFQKEIVRERLLIKLAAQMGVGRKD